MPLQPNIDYTIKLNGETFISKIELEDLEKFGLLQCLRNKNTFANEQEESEFEITFRKIHLTPFDPNYKPKDSGRVGNFQPKKYEDDKPYRVHLNTIANYLSLGLPEHIDVEAVSPSKAVVRALHKAKIFDFPNGWQGTKVTLLT
jgi:hypothetical protein